MRDGIFYHQYVPSKVIVNFQNNNEHVVSWLPFARFGSVYLTLIIDSFSADRGWILTDIMDFHGRLRLPPSHVYAPPRGSCGVSLVDPFPVHSCIVDSSALMAVCETDSTRGCGWRLLRYFALNWYIQDEVFYGGGVGRRMVQFIIRSPLLEITAPHPATLWMC